MMVKDIKEAHVMPDWNDCEHEWQEAEDSMATPETHTDVACKKCDCPGERTEATGEVFWPASVFAREHRWTRY